MICKEGAIDVISIGGSNGIMGRSSNGTQHTITNGHNTLQSRRKSQLITFSASSCDIKNSLSHEIIIVNNGTNGSINGGGRGSIAGSSSSSAGGVGSATNARLSFAEEDIIIVTNGGSGGGVGSVSVSGSGGSGSGHEADLEDDVFRRRSLEVDEELFDDEFETHIEASNNANDDSGGGSYEESHALHSSMGGSNRNSLEKDDDEVDVISTDVSCYDQFLGSSCNTRNDEDDIATLIGDGERFSTKMHKNIAINGIAGKIGNATCSSNGGGVGENGGIIYANPFMDDEGIAESGM